MLANVFRGLCGDGSMSASASSGSKRAGSCSSIGGMAVSVAGLVSAVGAGLWRAMGVSPVESGGGYS